MRTLKDLKRCPKCPREHKCIQESDARLAAIEWIDVLCQDNRLDKSQLILKSKEGAFEIISMQFQGKSFPAQRQTQALTLIGFIMHVNNLTEADLK